MRERELLVVTPAKDEIKYLPTVIDTMLRQTLLPARWVIADDGSTDGTAELAERAARDHDWITVIRKPRRGERRVGLASVAALEIALALPRTWDYDFLCIIDADIELPPTYFASILEEFERDEKLGIAAGQVYEKTRSGRLTPMRGAPEATAGAVKCWRRRCFEDIGGPINEPGWDGTDQYQAAMSGWTTRTFDHQEVRVTHLRKMGSSYKSIVHGRLRRGTSGYFMGSHPLWMLASAFYHATDSPWVVSSVSTLAGYFMAMLRRGPRVENPVLIQFVRRKQLDKLKALCRHSMASVISAGSGVTLWRR